MAKKDADDEKERIGTELVQASFKRKIDGYDETDSDGEDRPRNKLKGRKRRLTLG